MKKQNFILKSLLVFACLFVSIHLQAELSKTVHVATAGTLNTLITDDEKPRITELIVTGDLNGTDIVFMKSLGNSETYGTLSLDLTDANIVAGGGIYYSDMHYWYYTSKNTIGEYMFYGFMRLGSIKIPRSVTTIGNEAFRFCNGLKSLTIPEGVTTIGYYAFEECPILSLTIPASVTSIGHSAFSRCGMSSVTLPTGITTMGSAVFEHCINLTSVTIPSNIKRIEDYTFSDCIKLASITIPETVTSIGIGAFKGSGLRSITIPASIDTIEESTFEECGSLITVTLPSTIRTIGTRAFCRCGLASLVIPANVVTIKYSAFDSSALRFISCQGTTPPSALAGCFFNLNANFYVLVPKSSVDSYLSSPVWKDLKIVAGGSGELREFNVTLQEAGSLSGAIGADNLNDVLKLTISGAINGDDIFTIREKLPLLKFLDLGKATIVSGGTEYVTEDNKIGVSMFKDLLLESIVLPQSITSIGESAFAACVSLSSLTIPETVTSIGPYAFFQCSNLSSILLPSYISSIENGTFGLCSSLSSLTIPEGITSIGEGSFLYCSHLSSITIPASVTSIGNSVFGACYELTEIHIRNTTPPTTGINCFSDVDKVACTLYVLKNTSSAYSQAPVWKDFSNIIEEVVASVEQPSSDAVNIYSEKDVLIIVGAETGTSITVYSTTGMQIVTLIANGDEQRIALPAGALYLVKVGEQTFKVALLQ